MYKHSLFSYYNRVSCDIVDIDRTAWTYNNHYSIIAYLFRLHWPFCTLYISYIIHWLFRENIIIPRRLENSQSFVHYVFSVTELKFGLTIRSPFTKKYIMFREIRCLVFNDVLSVYICRSCLVSILIFKVRKSKSLSIERNWCLLWWFLYDLSICAESRF